SIPPKKAASSKGASSATPNRSPRPPGRPRQVPMTPRSPSAASMRKIPNPAGGLRRRAQRRIPGHLCPGLAGKEERRDQDKPDDPFPHGSSSYKAVFRSREPRIRPFAVLQRQRHYGLLLDGGRLERSRWRASALQDALSSPGSLAQQDSRLRRVRPEDRRRPREFDPVTARAREPGRAPGTAMTAGRSASDAASAVAGRGRKRVCGVQ